ncbi:MAG: hypothetical protein HC921_17470 [Synechococcaceae cyanobacterium SM2_3_1]|nr:hypothetical protein [Synechococcaceae cyanobacterium SM2_3_1]
MNYTFEILGVSPVLHFFKHQQQEKGQVPSRPRVAYVGVHTCTLDACLASIETSLPPQGWDLEHLLEVVINFWVTHPDSISHWKRRLQDAGGDSLLVTRVGSWTLLRWEFERLFHQPA